jgi:L-ascorbate metabolism protein UlaG (beta-lactamase superfamily)
VAHVEYVGHATVLVAMDGTRLLTDPVLRSRVAHLRRAVPVDADALVDVDAVLVSHLHFDHLDVPSLARIGRATPVVVPRGAGDWLRGKGFSDVTELAAGEELSIGGVRVRGTPADHDSGRLPFGIRADPLGFVLRGSRSVYFAGDTDMFEAMDEIGPVDVALVPVAGWGATLGPGHMDAERAARALDLLRPSVAVPIHWGTYFPAHAGLRGRPGWLDLPAAEFAARAAKSAPGVEVRVLRPGESTELDPGAIPSTP